MKSSLCIYIAIVAALSPAMLHAQPQTTTSVDDRKPATPVDSNPPDTKLAAPYFFATIGGGSGIDANGHPTAFVDAKFGGEAGLGLEYDRLAATNAFSLEGFLFEPIFRLPRFNRDRKRTFVEFYPEPAVGFRTGGGPFGGYASAGGMFLIKRDSKSNDIAPFLEIRHRFPFSNPMQGDTRIGFGIMFGAS